MVFSSMFASLGARIVFVVLAALISLGGAFYWLSEVYTKRCVSTTH